jgi:hypothetical protein
MQKDIGKHIVYADGRVWTKYWKRFMKFSINKQGYYYSIIEGKITLLHRLLAQTFIPNPNNLSDVDHINNNKLDNRLENLQWLSKSDNLEKRVLAKGEGHSNSKLSEEQVRIIRGGPMYVGRDSDLARAFSVSREAIRDVRLLKGWTHVTD